MQFDPDRVREYVQSLYMTKIVLVYGDEGIAALTHVMEYLRKLFQFLAADSIHGSLIVYKSIDSASMIHPEWASISSLEHITPEGPFEESSILNIECCADGTLKYSKNVELDLGALSQRAIVYLYSNRQDTIYIKGNAEPIFNLCPAYASLFCVPTYSLIKDALEDYKRRSIRTSNCPIFSECWYSGRHGPRLFFKQKPEATMRRSLANFLGNVLRDADVGQEQNVDESHPVDIRVTWIGNNQRGLIEIKWLGQSVDDNGKKKTEYFEARAQDGAKQLADYLDEERERLPLHDRRGYLVIVDGRRRGLSEGCTELDSELGLWYQDKEITFNPAFHQIRGDFEIPFRMFVEPRFRN
jgi:hypothetical protein